MFIMPFDYQIQALSIGENNEYESLGTVIFDLNILSRNFERRDLIAKYKMGRAK